jgi:acyl-coenzyme A synthetase/AMP-(fatty) acid ligase
MNPENPFLYLQRSAETNPNGVFSRSLVQTMTNADAVVEVKRIAFELRRLGVQAGDIVALDLPEQLSILFSQAVYHEAAVSTVLPEGYVVGDDVPVRWLFTNRPHAVHDGVTTIEVDGRFLRGIAENPTGIRPSTEPTEFLRIVFSSGTTGRPKAIGLGRDMEDAMEAALATWFEGGPALILMDTGTVWGFGEFFLSAKAGQPYLCAGGASPSAVVQLAEAAEVRTLKGSPHQLAAVVDELERQSRTLPRIERVFAAGTTMPVALAERMRAVTEGCVVLANYGSTEAGQATARPYESDDPTDAGFVVPGSVIEIVDDADEPVPVGTVGHVRHRAPGMATRYLGDPEASARAFRDGWFYPGDLGFFRADGGLTLAGRASEVINAGGVKLDPARLDGVALHYPGVEDACAFGYEASSGLEAIGLAVVVADGFDADALVEHLRHEFGVAAPTLVARVAQVPRTRAGKPLRRELAERYSGS